MSKYRGLHNNLNRFSKCTPVNVFCFLSLFFFAILVICFRISNGELLSRYFFVDTRDSGMDFFHSIEYMNGRKPYTIFGVVYPPLANLIYLFFFNMIPKGIVESWPLDFWASAGMRGTELDLRTYQALFFLFIIYTILISWLFILVIVRTLSSRVSYTKASCVALCVLLSYGVMYSIERGNLILLTFPLILFFANFVKSDNKIVSELALLSLSVAIGLKLYPAVFAIILLYDKEYKKLIRLILYSIVLLAVPSMFFGDNILDFFSSLIKNVLTSGLSLLCIAMPAKYVQLDGVGILSRVARYVQVYFGVQLDTKYFPVISIVIVVILLMFNVLHKKAWERILCCVVALILLQPQPFYILGLVTIPFVLFLKEEANFTKNNVIPFFLMLALVVPLPLFCKHGESYPYVVVQQFLLLSTLIWGVTSAIMVFVRKTKLKKTS